MVLSPRCRSLLLPALLSGGLAALAGCSSDARDASGDVADAIMTAHPHPFDVGMNEWVGEIVPYAEFRKAAGAQGPRLCHAYTYWNIAHQDPPGGDGTHTLNGLIGWFGKIQGSCDEVLVTFQGRQDKNSPEAAPHTATFEDAFVAFQRLTDPGHPLEAWRGKLSYTPWNEPNNQAPSGNGLEEPIAPELAARYYLAVRKHCAPKDGCKVAAGDFATNGATADDIAWNCANDNSALDTPGHCAQPSSFNHGDAPPSYLDRYKNEIALHAKDFGLPDGFRPEVLAYHPWHDVNGYLEASKACDHYDDCATRRLLHSMGGSWGGVEIWDTEIGLGLQTNPAPDETRQACAAAFLVQLTDLSPRIKRLYYMMFVGSNGPLFDGKTLRPAGHVLASGALTWGHHCAPTGMH